MILLAIHINGYVVLVLELNIMHSLVMLCVQFDHDVYMPTDEPHGTIEASLTRKEFTGFSKM